MQCQTLIGEGRAIVCVDYRIDQDGDIDIREVMAEGVNLIPYLLEEQMYDIELACRESSKQEAANDLYDRGQELHEERIAA